ncbi:S9 family peptidase, partial [Acidobacteria bacterium AH-259-O06]|nr:S9 family peptidase [Acidobacteria bacterium AH-259-O06]
MGFVVIPPLVCAQEAEISEQEAMYYRYMEFPSYVKGGSIDPHWMADGSSFWYAEGAPANTVIYNVDPRANTKTPLFETARLRQALTPLLGHEPPYQGLPFDRFTFVDKSEKAVKFNMEDKEFILQLDTYAITRAPVLSETEKSRRVPQIVWKVFPRSAPDLMEVLSPDGRWFAGLKEYNLWLRSTYDGRSVQLTTDGIEDYKWGGYEQRWAWWSPDSFKLALKKEDWRKVPKIPVVHWLKPVEEVDWEQYPPRASRAGGPTYQTELFILDILSKRQVHVDIGEEPDQFIDFLGWRPDGSELLFLRRDRVYKKYDLMAADGATGTSRLVLTETENTWVRTPGFTLLGDGKRFIWMSERDGWRHLYLYDLDGTLIQRLTEGAFSVVRVIAVDEQVGWVYFTAHGDQQRPRDTHLYRVNLEGKNFTRLTEGAGQHGRWRGSPPIRFAPSREFFLDTHSSVDRPPAVELRRADGTLLRTLSKANIDALKEELQWSPPEEFVVKAADGKTDLHGVLYKPYDFDPDKRYPVIEWIYGGADSIQVQRTFTARYWMVVQAQALAQLGFITFIVDGHLSKALLDVFYGNVGREIPDHVATLKQLGAKRPYMDLSRVGIYGYSRGGTNTLRAMLLAPDVYHVGVAGSPSSQVWAEGKMGLPKNNKQGYEYSSNLRVARNLKGKLLMIIGTSDINGPSFAETMKMVEAFIRAGKPYDLAVFPEQPHPTHKWTPVSFRYMQEAIRRYFQEHLKP